MLIEKLIPIGLATLSLGTIQESDGVQDHTFWLRNDGTEQVTLVQGYTSCGCTTIEFDRNGVVQPGDSTSVVLHFNPQGKGGEFYESGTIVYGKERQRVQVALTGHCITSEETLMRQFPVRVSEHLRLSSDHFDLGVMPVGMKRTLYVVVLHRDENNRQERFSIDFTADDKNGKGVKHILYPIVTYEKGKKVTLHIKLDVRIN